MKSKAIIYTRISAVENDYIHSFEQTEALYNFCTDSGIEAVAHFHDNANGASFNRKGWQKLISYLESHPNSIEYVFFTDWDRFSTSFSATISELIKLKSLGVKVSAIE